MSINTNLINWWLEKDPFTPDELSKIKSGRSANQIFSSDAKIFDSYTDHIVSLLPFCNISSNDYTVRFDVSLTAIIKKIFEQHVDDKTLIIATEREHFSASDIIEKCKNVYLLSHEKEIRKNNVAGALVAAECYDKVFLYIIGTQKGSGEITPQAPIERLIKSLKFQGKEVVAVSDDVHGWFFTPRDYSCYDYILHTAHSLATFFDLGVCIQKKNGIIVGEPIENWPKQWFETITPFVARKNKLLMFYKVMTEACFDMFASYNIDFVTYNNDNFFTLRFPKAANDIITQEEIKTLEHYQFYFDKVSGIGDYSYVAARAQQFLVEPEKLIPGVEYLNAVIKRLHKEGVV